MSEPNPYQPPQSPEPLTTAKAVKRGVGVAVVLLLTPVAAAIATAGSCAAVDPVINAVVPPGAYGLAFVVGWLVFLLPPALTVIVMLWWAVRVQRRDRQLPRRAE